MKALRVRVATKRSEEFQARKAQAERTKAKQDLKKLNQMKSAKYQIVSTTSIGLEVRFNLPSLLKEQLSNRIALFAFHAKSL